MSYIALFLTPELMLLGSKKFKPTDSFLNFKKGTFNIRLDSYLYKTKESTIFGYIYPTDERVLIDVTKEGIKTYNQQEPIKIGDKTTKLESARIVFLQEKIEHGDLHLLVAESIIGQLARAFLGGVKTNWILIILALGAGLGIGYMICTGINPSHTITVIQNATSTTPIPHV
jgi:hypothetical protein